jgi:hypothetical protein
MSRILFYMSFVILVGSCFPSKNSKNTQPNDEIKQLKKQYNFAWDSIEIQKLNIKLLEGLPGFYLDERNVSVIPVDSLSLEIDTSKITPINGRLRITTIDVDTISVGIGCGKLTNISPHRIGMVTIRKLTLTKGGEVIAQIDKSMNVVNFHVYSYDLQCERLAPTIDSIEFRIVNLEKRIRTLLMVIEQLVAEMPDHAAKKLPPTLQEFLGSIAGIKGFYFKQDEMLINDQTEADLNQLNNIKFSLEVQEKEVNNPDNNPQFIENEVLFRTGKFEIIPSAPVLDGVVADIKAKILDIETKYSDMPVKMILVVTGYADEQKIEEDLELVLKNKFPKENIPNLNKQEILNKLLSQARADNVYAYIINRLPSKTKLGKPIEFERNDAIGKGWIYPPNSPNSCPNDCQARRVVYTSHIVYPKR